MKEKTISIYSLLFLLLTGAISVCAQTTLSLEEAWKRAVAVSADANFSNAVYGLAEAESKLGVFMPFMNTMAEAGQINSALVDTKITLSQSGYLPSYHKAFKNRQEGYKAIAGSDKQLREWEIRKMVTSLFIQHHFLVSIKRVYANQDSLFRQALERARLRMSTGESDGVEVVEATAQLSHLQLLKQETESASLAVLAEFRILTGSTEATTPEEIEDVAQLLPVEANAMEINQHPYLRRMEAEMKFNEMEAGWKRAQRKAFWTVAISNTSFRGIGADERTYSASSRFSSVQLGISFPLFGRQRSKVEEVIKLTDAKTTAEKALAEVKISNQLNIARMKWQRVRDQLRSFEQQSLPLATQLLDIAANKLKNGEIDFMKYAFMTEQAQALLLDYANLKKQVNEAVLDYHFVNF